MYKMTEENPLFFYLGLIQSMIINNKLDESENQKILELCYNDLKKLINNNPKKLIDGKLSIKHDIGSALRILIVYNEPASEITLIIRIKLNNKINITKYYFKFGGKMENPDISDISEGEYTKFRREMK